MQQQPQLWKRQNLLVLDWAELGRSMERITQSIVDSGYKPTCVVGICRGGLPLATHISNVLGIPRFHVLSITRNLSNERYSQRGPPRFGWMAPEGSFEGERVLLADDIVGDGGTLAAAVSHMRSLNPLDVRTAVVVKNQKAQYQPDHVALTVDDWVVFPWEPRVGMKEAPDAPTQRLALAGDVPRQEER